MSAAPAGEPGQLLQRLVALQAQRGWLPPAALEALAVEMALPLAELRGVAGFYRFLHLAPVGRLRLLFSDHVSDRHQGAPALMARLCARLGVAPGQVRADGALSIDRCSCIGLADQGPSLLVNHGQVITRLDAARIDALAQAIEAGLPPAAWPAEWQQVDEPVRRADVLLGAADAPGAALAAALAQPGSALIEALASARLLGRGGAGYPVADKWRACAAQPVTERVVVCNADEGEPGTFKDRTLLRLQPDALIEGMTLAAWALGARHGLIYLRGEYRWLLPGLQQVLARRRAAGLLGAAIAGRPGFDFDIAIHLGAGAYVCGEESALLESLEGRRGVPRIRPPYPSSHGWRGLPTVVNNVETFCCVAQIALRGAARWAAIGTARATGTKIHSVSGDCARPGLYEYPLGTPVARILADCGAVDAQAVQVGGPSGHCVPARDFGRRIAQEDLPSAGAFTVFGPGRDLFEVARHAADFFAHESCGFCTPCRVGTTLMARRFDKIAAGSGSRHDLDALRSLTELLGSSSHCGLGASAGRMLHDTLRHHRPAYEQRLQSLQFVPGFDLDAELSQARALTGRHDAGAHLATRETDVTRKHEVMPEPDAPTNPQPQPQRIAP
ncbi:NADH-ubiquinone oxidoreductase-F iron-sulfur binding region domain-containing protein [Aquabacterium sp. OR-4]|uniref:NADH-ubiquinone oxidoreductase-F iron-sulfur binding region domain-containing protein n=1 Tax=Aquabacterium sp. OR-4 TaxID=2978127 RepID=UPI0021B2CE96|nr:NADH-ubiquinone oxidoreductase-F iron-sulfur binding region domain-containing protein [Aquabacterium sp. OR-4]MDT7834377.1 NADH-ubiquinone oxidoreductase-F iron-sulfur binding region domain-containing protein [Aquabacterium sp. OR-4]